MKKKQNILIVDDDERNIRLLKAILRQENYHIFQALNGNDALSIAKEINLDLILLDVLMPGMDGFSVCRKIRKNKKTQIIPVLMVTVLTDKKDREKAMQAGADDFLTKPVRKNELLSTVKSLLCLN